MVLSPQDLATISRLLDHGMDLDPAEVAAWLAALPESQCHLVPPLREMLAARRLRGGLAFLEHGPSLDETASDPNHLTCGDAVGPYRLIREIGQGGMGTVWLAERHDGSLKRRVALKLPRLAWDAGLADRMARERDIGALLEHPHIARLYDAGVDDSGRPYLALEYVDGLAVDVWCQSRQLPVPERLRVFLQIARAVAYAHGRLVVHRDLKPSNVLVTPDGQAHLLDFGIAKLLTQAPGADDALTREQGRLLTPQYASPEQYGGGPITVASDIYSLGALLYRLLTGSHPYTVRRGTAAAFEEAVLEGEVALASTRAADPATARLLRGDIDAILTKALQRLPADRYPTVDGLVDDIERHLGGQAVLARPDRLGYRAWKAARRHRLAVSAACAVLAAVLGGAGLAFAQAHRAQAEAERARLVKEFLVDIFNTRFGPDGSVGQMPGIALLERGAKMIDTKFGGQPLLQAELYGVVSAMFYNLANLEQAAKYATQQIETLSAANAPAQQIARATLGLVDIFIPMQRNDDAYVRARKAIELASGDPVLQARARALKATVVLFGHADTAQAQVELDAADAALRRGDASPADRAALALARGIWFAFRKLPDEARKQFDDAIALGLAAEGPTSIHALHGREEAAKTLLMAGRFEEGRPYLSALVSMLRNARGPDDVTAATWEALGATWMLRGEVVSVAEALGTYERSLAAMRAQKWAVPRSEIASIEYQMGLALLLSGEVERGAALTVSTREAATTGPDPVSQWWKRLALVRALAPSGRADEAVILAREMLSLKKGWATFDLQETYKLLALALVHGQRYEEAERALAEYDVATAGAAKPEGRGIQSTPSLDEVRMLVALERGKPGLVLGWSAQLPQPSTVHGGEIAWLSRASALCRTGASGEGLRLFGEWLPRLATDRFEASPHVAYWRARMGLCALQAGQRKDAAEASQWASAAIAAQPGVSSHYKAPVRELEQRLRRN